MSAVNKGSLLPQRTPDPPWTRLRRNGYGLGRSATKRPKIILRIGRRTGLKIILRIGRRTDIFAYRPCGTERRAERNDVRNGTTCGTERRAERNDVRNSLLRALVGVVGVVGVRTNALKSEFRTYENFAGGGSRTPRTPLDAASPKRLRAGPHVRNGTPYGQPRRLKLEKLKLVSPKKIAGRIGLASCQSLLFP